MNCNCIHCRAKKSGREFTEFFRDWLTDNIQLVKLIRDLPLVDEKPPEAVEIPNSDFTRQSPTPPDLTESEWLDHLDMLEAEEWHEAQRDKSWAPLVYPSCHISPRGDGISWTKVYEHKVQTGWTWRGLRTYSPPVPNGQRETLRLSPKARKRLLECCNAVGRHYKGAVFVTLTYKESVCQTEAKRDFDRFWKRVKNWTGYKNYVWVAELQKRGVIHFHILVEGRLDAAWIQDTWRSITQQEVYTHVGGIGKAYAYMAKYMGKACELEPIVGRRWSASREVTKWTKPLYQTTINQSFEEWDRHRMMLKRGKHYEWMSTQDLKDGEIVPNRTNTDLWDLLK